MDLSKLSDDKLVVLIKSTYDQKAYAELVIRHQAALLAFLTQYTNDAFVAQDICQESLLKGYTKIEQFKGDCSYKTWLFSIAYREFLQFQRKVHSFDKLRKVAAQSVEDRVNNQQEDSIDLMNALHSLAPNEKAAVLLNEACGLTHSEVAIAMDLPLGSVKTFIRRGKQALLEKLDE